MRMQRLAATLVGLAFAAGGASAQTVNTTDRGWVNQLGFHQPSNTNYFVGTLIGGEDGDVFRNFFVFDVPTIGGGGDYTAALLRLFSDTAFVGIPETFSVWSVESNIDSLIAGTGGPQSFEDLADGSLLGTATIETGSDRWIDVELNTAGVAAVNARKGQRIALGGTLTNNSQLPTSYAFGYTGSTDPADGDTKLVLRTTGGTNGGGTTGGDPVPEPGEWAAMGILGTTLAMLVVRRRRAA